LTRESHHRRTYLAIGFGLFVAAVIAAADLDLLAPVYRFISRHPGADKLGHFTLIGGMAFLLYRCVRAPKWRWVAPAALALAMTIEELTQRYLPGRSFDLGDLAMNYAGIAVFTLLAYALDRDALRRRPPPQW
jgi:VanZ family protein